MLPAIPPAGPKTVVLLVHAPYPVALKFDALPSSLLHAVAPFARRLQALGTLETLGYLDPGSSSPAFDAEFERAVCGRELRAVCISTSTAAVEETARLVEVIRLRRGSGVLVVVGGPHEDAVHDKCAERLWGVDLSLGGDAAALLDRVLVEFLEREESPAGFCRRLASRLDALAPPRGRLHATSPWWDGKPTRHIDRGRLQAADLCPPAFIDRPVHFAPFRMKRVLPVLVSRGCAWGRCTFCSEAGPFGGQLVMEDFAWLETLLASYPAAAVYFQDSVFPMSQAVRAGLLPRLLARQVEWGCQLYLPQTTPRGLETLSRHGCRYVYTGLESAAPEILAAVGKSNLKSELVFDRLRLLRDLGVKVGVSFMFGGMTPEGDLLEDEGSVAATVELAERIASTGVEVAGFYPNVETVLPGTELQRTLAASGRRLDFYRLPRSPVFEGLEDGELGHNFLTLVRPRARKRAEEVALAVRTAALWLSSFEGRAVGHPST